jgi:hypothetical protein
LFTFHLAKADFAFWTMAAASSAVASGRVTQGFPSTGEIVVWSGILK